MRKLSIISKDGSVEEIELNGSQTLTFGEDELLINQVNNQGNIIKASHYMYDNIKLICDASDEDAKFPLNVFSVIITFNYGKFTSYQQVKITECTEINAFKKNILIVSALSDDSKKKVNYYMPYSHVSKFDTVEYSVIADTSTNNSVIKPVDHSNDENSVPASTKE